MSVIAYLLLPLTGVFVFLFSIDERARFHGLQAIAFGTLWALLLYAGSVVSPGVTQVVFVAGALVWLVLIAAAAAGRDLRLPLLGRYLAALAAARYEDDVSREA